MMYENNLQCAVFNSVHTSNPCSSFKLPVLHGCTALWRKFNVARKRSLTMLLGCMVSVAGFSVNAAPLPYTLDKDHTTVAFLVDHIGYAKTLGWFADVNGSFTYDEETRELSDLRVTVQTNSIQSDHKARDKHLRSKDFLNVKKHPEMTFVVATATLQDETKATITGELTLLGQTQPVTLDVSLNKSDTYPFGHKLHTLGISAKGSLQRSAFGMQYGVANALVGDQIDLIVEVEANQK